jgi:acyl carrier protein
MARLAPESDLSLTRVLQVAARVTGSGPRRSPPPEGDAAPATRLRDVGVTSYLLFQFIRELEAEFGVRFPDQDLHYSRFETIGQVMRLVEHRRRSHARPG